VAKTIPLKFEYVNWEGKKAVRKVEPIKIWYGKTQWHPKKQWFLKALDLDKNEERDFAIKDIIKFL
jgi:predicted DNA-binding transcriptional regulator YafY